MVDNALTPSPVSVSDLSHVLANPLMVTTCLPLLLSVSSANLRVSSIPSRSLLNQPSIPSDGIGSNINALTSAHAAAIAAFEPTSDSSNSLCLVSQKSNDWANSLVFIAGALISILLIFVSSIPTLSSNLPKPEFSTDVIMSLRPPTKIWSIEFKTPTAPSVNELIHVAVTMSKFLAKTWYDAWRSSNRSDIVLNSSAVWNASAPIDLPSISNTLPASAKTPDTVTPTCAMLSILSR